MQPLSVIVGCSSIAARCSIAARTVSVTNSCTPYTRLILIHVPHNTTPPPHIGDHQQTSPTIHSSPPSACARLYSQVCVVGDGESRSTPPRVAMAPVRFRFTSRWISNSGSEVSGAPDAGEMLNISGVICPWCGLSKSTRDTSIPRLSSTRRDEPPAPPQPPPAAMEESVLLMAPGAVETRRAAEESVTSVEPEPPRRRTTTEMLSEDPSSTAFPTKRPATPVKSSVKWEKR